MADVQALCKRVIVIDAGRLLPGLYTVVMKAAVQTQFQYRTANYAYMLGMVAEPVVYLVVWSAVANSRGGSVDGITAGEFAAYHIVWTLVVVVVLWIPIAAVLSIAFRPTFHITALHVTVFLVAIWGTYLIRSMLLWVLGMITFWTTRVSAIYDTYFTAELLLSGRLVPLALLPAWAAGLADVLPFKYTFGYPIEVLAGSLSTAELFTGLAFQAAWIVIGAAASCWSSWACTCSSAA